MSPQANSDASAAALLRDALGILAIEERLDLALKPTENGHQFIITRSGA